MEYRKIECKEGWIVIVVEHTKILEIHSTGYIGVEIDSRGFVMLEDKLLNFAVERAIQNKLNSQQDGYCGLRWPMNDLIITEERKTKCELKEME